MITLPKSHAVKTADGITIYLIPGFIMAISLWWFLGISIEHSLPLGYILWSALYFWGLFDYLWKNPEPNTALIIQNPWIKARRQTILTKAGTAIPEGQFVIFTGWNAVLPWYKIVNKPISLIVEEPCPITVDAQDKNFVKFTFKLGLLIAPIQDEYLPLFYQTSERAALDFFKARYQLAFEAELADKDGDDVIKYINAFLNRTGIKDLFGGENITEEEREYARYVNRLIVYEIEKEIDAQNIAQLVKAAEQLATAIARLNVVCKDEGTRAMAIAALTKEKINLSQVRFTLRP